MWTCSKHSTGSKSPKLPEAPKASRGCNQSRRQGSPDGQRQMENCKETWRHNRSAWWQLSQWFPLQLKLRSCRPVFLMLSLTLSCLTKETLIWPFWKDCAPYAYVFQQLWIRLWFTFAFTSEFRSCLLIRDECNFPPTWLFCEMWG